MSNPDGGGSRIEHVIARAKERCGLVLTVEDIEKLEHHLWCGSCDRPMGWVITRTRPHGHQDWEVRWRGEKMRLVYDPAKRHVRTIMALRGSDGDGFRLGDVVRKSLPKDK